MTDREKELEGRVQVLFNRNQELVRQLMLRSATMSEAEEEAEKLRSAMKLHRAQEGHNKCWKNDYALHQAIGDNVKCACPDPENVTLEEFALGCLNYIPTQFKDITAAQYKLLADLSAVLKAHMLKDIEVPRVEDSDHPPCIK